MQKVQVMNLSLFSDEKKEFIIDEYKTLGFTTKVVGDDLELYWGKPARPKKKREEKREEPEHKPGQEKTARRLGR